MTLPTTPSQTVGPYYALGLCRRADNELVRAGSDGALRLIGAVLDGDGVPIGDAMVEVWDAVGRRWGRSGTDSEGRFWFTVTKPKPPRARRRDSMRTSSPEACSSTS